MPVEDAEYRTMYEVEDGHWWYVSLHDLIIHSLPTPATGLRILDAGCGTGRLLELLSRYGRAEGCDASTEAVSFCRKRGLERAVQADLNTLEMEREVFDVITSIDVLYHQGIQNDRAVIIKMYEALKPGGTLLLHLPAYQWMRSSHDIAVRTARRYQRRPLVKMLQECGFTVRKSTYRVSLLFPFIAAVRLFKMLVPGGPGSKPPASDVRKHSPIVNQLLTAVMRLENRFLDSLSLPFGSSIFVVARKEPSRPVRCRELDHDD
jgi:2-polyprenyl-3-methyl-5-hydroxy-6-metoxy-1,4-benzoquinol methylase